MAKKLPPNQTLYWLPRKDLEALTGISPIESIFMAAGQRMEYRHNDKTATIMIVRNPDYDDYTNKDFLNKEAEVCKQAFK